MWVVGGNHLIQSPTWRRLSWSSSSRPRIQRWTVIHWYSAGPSCHPRIHRWTVIHGYNAGPSSTDTALDRHPLIQRWTVMSAPTSHATECGDGAHSAHSTSRMRSSVADDDSDDRLISVPGAVTLRLVLHRHYTNVLNILNNTQTSALCIYM